MQKTRIRALTWVLVALVLVAGTAYFLRFHPSRMSPLASGRLTYLKLTGAIPEVTWRDVGLVFSGREQWPHFASELVKGDVQFKRRAGDAGCPDVYNTPVGEIHAKYRDGELLEGILAEIVGGKIYDSESAHISKGDVVMDVGSHLGAFARYAFQQGASRVIAFEPDPDNVKCLKLTFANEIKDKTYTLVEAAVSGSAGSITLYQHVNSSMSRTIEKGDEPGLKDWEKKVFKPWNAVGAQEKTIDVPAVTIDSTLQSLGIDKLDFIKMDIEGAERYAVAGAQGTLQRLRPRMVLCTYHRPDDAKVLPDLVLKAQPSYRVTTTKTQAFFF